MAGKKEIPPRRGDLTGMNFSGVGRVKQILAERNQQDLRYDESGDCDNTSQNHEVYEYPLRHSRIRCNYDMRRLI